MADDDNDPNSRAVPGSRRARLGQFGRLAGGLAGGVMAEGARRLAEGKRPRMQELLLTPANIGRVADRLSHLRGAAMKLGQMVSLDAGDVLPPELSDIMARLRENAHSMPPKQLEAVLADRIVGDQHGRESRAAAWHAQQLGETRDRRVGGRIVQRALEVKRGAL